ncbi:hypothetical protein MMH89_02230 [Candidatus Comchoanobacter bicostacola]|uniref:Transglycosylase SLT domain-containing protein n=1 Tax=Candidatus Comchoanobacter bicostacola TaxID=2919598 RepID=A0ABY5DLI6_9GAMM|nr:hypothetical protein [Candidatus Comchoanobacter bicostacola]UTC24965.1 hypothetical protein MMH89_02230 [Candidatus Comchoanobacter bicostacola]
MNFNILFTLCSVLILSGCSDRQFQANVYENDICRVIHANPGWAEKLKQVQKRYGIEPNVVLSVISHESSFRSHARAQRSYFWGVIPYRRESSFGYGQVKDETWQWYLSKNPGYFRSRTSFRDTSVFIGWYYQQYLKKAPESRVSAYDFYIAYRNGLGGYEDESVMDEWMIGKCSSVQELSDRYRTMLLECM